MLPKAQRMKGEDVDLLFSRAKMVKNPLFSIKYLKNEENTGKTGKVKGNKGISVAVAASKKIFKTAVERNATRRRIYAAVRTAQVTSIPFSIIFMPNREALQAPYKTLVEAISNVCKNLK